MFISSNPIVLSDGSRCEMGSPSPQDAKHVLNYLKVVAKETPYMVRYIDEIGDNKRDVLYQIKDMKESPNRLSLIVYKEHTILGMASFCEISPYRKAKHRASLSVFVKREVWGLGIGYTLLTALISNAPKAGFNQLELEVACENLKAINLYLSLGFTIYGRRENAYYIEEQGFMPEYLMYKTL